MLHDPPARQCRAGSECKRSVGKQPSGILTWQLARSEAANGHTRVYFLLRSSIPSTLGRGRQDHNCGTWGKRFHDNHLRVSWVWCGIGVRLGSDLGCHPPFLFSLLPFLLRPVFPFLRFLAGSGVACRSRIFRWHGALLALTPPLLMQRSSMPSSYSRPRKSV